MHGIKGERIDATCINDPYHIEGLTKGDRAEHSIERVTDWIVMLPFANLTPRTMPTARNVRSKRDQSAPDHAAGEGGGKHLAQSQRLLVVGN